MLEFLYPTMANASTDQSVKVETSPENGTTTSQPNPMSGGNNPANQQNHGPRRGGMMGGRFGPGNRRPNNMNNV